MKTFFLLVTLLSLALSFPIESITITQDQLSKLNSTKPDLALANSLLTKALQPFF